ncbi:SRPBCC family protein [Azospirillum halopraeferens]|uniref:SRPBCC family protein n=1 Tax=Azospirillum halopraeferens TaxID=34010 RepID=UPI0004237D2A|nr:SRPBCC family protein [Azospirillum halopraeferens]
MKGLGLLLAAALVAAAPAADAHGPTRQKVTRSVAIAAPPDKVWSLVGDFAAMDRWHPAVEKTQAEGGNTPGATRVLVLKGGGEIAEKLERYEPEKRSYFYRITDVNIDVLPVANYSAWIEVKPGDGGGALVEWRGAFYRGYMNNDPPEQYNDEAARTAVTGVYDAGLANLKALAEGQ